MDAFLGEVVIYPPPQDGLPYVIVVIIDDDPQLVGFETTLEQAAATAKTTRDALWRDYKSSARR